MANILTVNGGSPLVGDLEVRGAKNLVSKAMVAALLAEGPCRLRGVPEISDVKIVSGLLELHGVKIDSTDRDGELLLDPTQRRAGPRRRHRRARRVLASPDPAVRPAAAPPRRGLHPRPGRLQDRRAARSTTTSTCCASSVPTSRSVPRACTSTAPDGLKGTKIELPYPSVGATEQVLLTAVRAEGVTELRNAAVEPEIVDLIAVLQKMGAIISVETDRVIRIDGVDRLGGYNHRALPDRIEAASWACAALATKGDIYVRGRPAAGDDDVPQHLPQDRRGLRHRRRRHPLLAPRRHAQLRSCSRPTSTPAS